MFYVTHPASMCGGQLSLRNRGWQMVRAETTGSSAISTLTLFPTVLDYNDGIWELILSLLLIQQFWITMISFYLCNFSPFLILHRERENRLSALSLLLLHVNILSSIKARVHIMFQPAHFQYHCLACAQPSQSETTSQSKMHDWHSKCCCVVIWWSNQRYFKHLNNDLQQLGMLFAMLENPGFN